ncbi:MAG TPA: ArdC family protein [Bacteroidales bacterium]|nr:ArdC family protein [Bacteroidales bacterium]
MNIYQLLKESKQLLNQSVQLNLDTTQLISEALELELHEDLLVVVSNEEDRRKASQETFRNKSALYAAGFRWNSGINAWVIDKSEFNRVKPIIMKINQSAKNQLADRANELLDKIQNTSDLRSHSPGLSRKEELSVMIEKFVEDLTTAIDDVKASETFRKYLEFGLRFRSYSWYNTMLIWMQRPSATKVAGFKQWQDKFYRRVKKGAKGITILAPMISKKKEEPDEDGIDSTDLDPVKKEKEYKQIRFMAVTVFDISDTEPIDERGEVPEEPNWKGSNDPNEKADEVYECAAELADNMGIKLETGDAKGSEMGWAKGDHINITSNIAGVNRAATLIHEIAHELLHFKKSSPFYVGDVDDVRLTREVAELQAETVSYIVIRYYELPAEHHATYLAFWKGNKDAISKNITHIRKAADFIIKEIDKIQEYRKKEAGPDL